eukprot:4878110-Amphidinium_carterae.1
MADNVWALDQHVVESCHPAKRVCVCVSAAGPVCSASGRCSLYCSDFLRSYSRHVCPGIGWLLLESGV